MTNPQIKTQAKLHIYDGISVETVKQQGSDGQKIAVPLFDTNGNGKADTNLDFDKNGIPDINVDKDKDGKADWNQMNQDTDGDGKCDLNCDTDNDEWPDRNVDVDGDGKPDYTDITTGQPVNPDDLIFTFNSDVILPFLF